MAERELQRESEQFLLELARHPNSVHKSPTNQYQHFVNAVVVTNDTKMKRADVVKRAQVEWKERAFDSEEHYVAAHSVDSFDSEKAQVLTAKKLKSS